MTPSDEKISTHEFETRLPYLCVTRRGGSLPRRRRDLHIVLKSVALTLDRTGVYTETRLNTDLRQWLDQVGYNFRLDHVTLRRTLVDYGYVRRNPAGTQYHVSSRNDGLFDPLVESLDPAFVVEEAERQRNAKRKAYLARKPG
jgi:hypothetical protein